AVDLVMLQGLVDLLPAPLDLRIGDDDSLALSVVDVVAGGLRGEAAFGERARGEGVWGAAARIAGAKKALDRRHAVVAPEIFGRGNVLPAGAPGARACRVGAHDVRLGRGELRVLVLGIDVGGGP